MVKKVLGVLLMLALALCALAMTAPHAAFAGADSIVYGIVYVDGSPVQGVTVTCGDQATTTLRSGNYYFNVEKGVTMQVLAVYDEHVALSDEFVTSEFPTRRDLNIITSNTSAATSVPIATPAPTQPPGPSIIRTYHPDSSTATGLPGQAKERSPGFAASLALACLAGAALIMASKKGR